MIIYPMNDFLIIPRRSSSSFDRIATSPPECMVGAVTHEFSWGIVHLLPPRDGGLAPLAVGDDLYFAVGRPTVGGRLIVDAPHASAMSLIAEAWRTEGPEIVGEHLSGMFALARCSDSGFEVLTDRLGARPVYRECQEGSATGVWGSQLETVAEAAGLATDFDAVSLGELLCYSTITWPFTTRRGLRELSPGSHYRVRSTPHGMAVEERTWWEPSEPSRWPGNSDLDAALRDGLRMAGRELTRNCERVAVALSGGADSRAVLAVMPPSLTISGITFARYDNRELRVAREVARLSGIPHRTVRRSEEFYADLPARCLDLVGGELRPEAHGLAVVDCGLEREFDVIVGGFLSDTLLKDHFMPPARKRLLGARGPVHRFWRTLRGRRTESWWDIIRRRCSLVLRAPIRDEVVRRRSERLSTVMTLRPETADEWVWFWPLSRQPDMGYALANSRAFEADELFLHRSVVDVAARAAPSSRVDARLTKRVFAQLYRELASIENANTGVLPGVGARTERLAKRRLQEAGPQTGFKGADVWNHVEHSWIDFPLMQTHSPAWQLTRRTVLESAAVDFLDQILAGGASCLVGEYQHALGPDFNYLLAQTGLLLAKWLT